MTLTRHRILYVEDHHDTCEMVMTILGLLNLEVSVAHTAAEGLALAERLPFHLCLLDTQLPDKSGLELCRELRALHPTLPVVFISGQASDYSRQQGLSAGAQAYLIKPITAQELKQAVFQVLDSQENVA